MSDAATRRRARGGGGAARRAARSAVSFDTAKYIERNIPNFEVLTEEVLEIIETNAETLLEEIGEDLHYAPYIARQDAELRELRANEQVRLAPDFPFAQVPGLSNEMVERLSRARPDSLAQAGRVAGITPAAMAALLVYARKYHESRAA